MTKTVHPDRAILEACDFSDIDYVNKISSSFINTMDSLQCPGKFYRKTHPFQEMDVAVVFSV